MNHGPSIWLQLLIISLLITAIIVYSAAGLLSSARKHLKKWPLYRYVCWICGVICAAIAVVGPVANRSHTDFIAHMLGHLYLGMLAPLFLVLSAPITLLLRTLSVKKARRVSKVLKSRPIRFLSNPIVASILTIGGLWILYTTPLFTAMANNQLLHVVVHLHVFLSGYLFTASIIYIDPIAHRFGFFYRSIVLIVALSGHQIVSKYIYAYPPVGVPAGQAEIGAMLMYYGGDAIDIMIIIIFCNQWFKATRPKKIELNFAE